MSERGALVQDDIDGFAKIAPTLGKSAVIEFDRSCGFRVVDVVRRYRIRVAARARKARRGWR